MARDQAIAAADVMAEQASTVHQPQQEPSASPQRQQQQQVTSEAAQPELPQKQHQNQQQRKAQQGAARADRPRNLAQIPTPSRGGRSPGVRGEGGRGQAGGLEEVMRRKGVDEAWDVFEDMQNRGLPSDKYTVSRLLMKTVGDGRGRLNAPRMHRSMGLVERFIESQPGEVDEVLFNALLDVCCRLKDLARLEALVQRMREINVAPSPVTLGILVKTYGQAGDLQKVLQVWNEMETQRANANAVTYGCMLDACVKCGHLAKAIEIFTGMKKEGKHKNTILYTTLIKGYGLEKNLPRAIELFREMAAEGVPYNTITFNSILEACVRSNDVAAAESLLQEMLMPMCPVEPDLITFSTVLKGYCHAGSLQKALGVLESIKARGLRCDELVYNTLMDGCVRANDVTAGEVLFEEMVSLGLRPSAITSSILTRLYHRVYTEDEANDFVARLYHRHGIDRSSGGGDSRRTGGSHAHRVDRRSPTASPSVSESGWSCYGLEGFRGESMTPLATTPALAGSPMLPLGLPMVPPMPGLSRESTPYGSFGCCTPATCSPAASPMSSRCGASAWVSPHTGFPTGPSFGAIPAMQQGMGQHTMQPMAGHFMSPPAVPPFPIACAATTPAGGFAPQMCGDMQIVAVPVMVGAPSHGDVSQQQHMQQQQQGQFGQVVSVFAMPSMPCAPMNAALSPQMFPCPQPMTQPMPLHQTAHMMMPMQMQHMMQQHVQQGVQQPLQQEQHQMHHSQQQPPQQQNQQQQHHPSSQSLMASFEIFGAQSSATSS